MTRHSMNARLCLRDRSCIALSSRHPADDRTAQLARAARASVEALEGRQMLCSTAATAALFPPPAAGATITTPLHTWVADANGLYHTSTDLGQEWKGYYATMQAKQGSTLSPIQRLEGNAEAVFENTGLSTLDAATLARDREDVQREFDAMAAAMQINATTLNIDPKAPLTEHAYIWLGKTLQNDPNLWELGLQGHGLNSPFAVRYRGYTNDFQNNVDNTTLFIGGGLNNNQKAIADFFDDDVLSHLPFPVVVKNGNVVQLNQNANAENSLEAATIALDDFMYGRTLGSADFSTTKSTANNKYVPLYKSLVAASHINLAAFPVNGQINGLLGTVSTTITGITPHDWTADASGQFHTTTDLAAEWQGDLALLQKGQAVTPIQRLEANAEVVFENTKISKMSAAYQAIYREDAQREFDALATAMQVNQSRYGTSATVAFTPTTYLALERTIQSDPTLTELAMQGHGLNNPPGPRYRGYTNDFQNNVDSTTRYVGGGLNNGRNALTDFFDDNIISHAVFPSVWKNGKFVQLNQNANQENGLFEAVNALNQSMFYRQYAPADFAQ